MSSELIYHLKSFITERRADLFEKVLEQRTRYITVALEDIYQPQNASAVLRSCDCFGIQDVHIIENKNECEIDPEVALGSSQWLSLCNYREKENNTLETINKLRNDGYRIVATTPHANDVDLQDFDLEKGKTALFFGTELKGLSDLMMANADEFVKIPMYGFTESFNISVSAAITMHHLVHKLRNSDIDWKLTLEENQAIHLNWLRNSIKRSDLIEKEFVEKLV